MENLLRLDGRIVVVSGAGGGGIGTTVASMVARAGATMLAVSRSKARSPTRTANAAPSIFTPNCRSTWVPANPESFQEGERSKDDDLSRHMRTHGHTGRH